MRQTKSYDVQDKDSLELSKSISTDPQQAYQFESERRLWLQWRNIFISIDYMRETNVSLKHRWKGGLNDKFCLTLFIELKCLKVSYVLYYKIFSCNHLACRPCSCSCVQDSVWKPVRTKHHLTISAKHHME